LIIAIIGMILTLSFDFDFDKKTDYYLHCIGSLTFSVVMGVTIFILFVICYNKDKIFRFFTFVTAGILLVDLVCLIIFKENALIEVIPVFAGYVMLSTVNMRGNSLETVR
jgi:presenilin-like A22 family membrane protease